MAPKFAVVFTESHADTIALWGEEFGLEPMDVVVAAMSLFHIARDLKFGIGDDDRSVVELLDDVVRIAKGVQPGGPGL
jgi:hypothetical protein